MVAHYSGRPTYRVIDGRQSPERVRQSLIEALTSALGCQPSELVAGRERA
jgi:DNA-binding Xre family transcriptional regulator